MSQARREEEEAVQRQVANYRAALILGRMVEILTRDILDTEEVSIYTYPYLLRLRPFALQALPSRLLRRDTRDQCGHPDCCVGRPRTVPIRLRDDPLPGLRHPRTDALTCPPNHDAASTEAASLFSWRTSDGRETQNAAIIVP